MNLSINSMQRQIEKPKLMPWVLLSALLHLGAVIVYFIVSTSRSPFLHDHQVIEVRIVQKGKPRDENLLPRQIVEEQKVEAPVPIAKEPEPAPPPAPAPKPEPQKHAISDPKSKATEQPKKPPRKSVRDALRDIAKVLEKEGKEEGMDYGNSLTGELTDAYAARVLSILKESFVLPSSLTEHEKQTLMMKVNIRFDEDGTPTVKVTRPSRNPNFDNAVVVNIENVKAFDAPPKLIRKKMKREGLDIEWYPIRSPKQD